MIKNNIAYSSNWQMTVAKAQGSYLWDENDRQILDFTSGWNVANLGWNNPEVAEAMITQISKNVYVPMEMGEEIQYEYAKALTAALPEELNVVSRATSGTEANEQAIKIARASTGRTKIIGFYNSYHGASLANLSLGYRSDYVAKISPLVPEFIQLEFPTTSTTHQPEEVTLNNYLNILEALLRQKDVAAVVTEPGIITGWGSTYVAPAGFLTATRKLTEEFGTLLILDEVGTSLSRTGKLFGMQHENVVPDIVTFAKSISNGGAAIGALVAKQEIVESVIADTFLYSNFGWTPVACAAALATLQIHQRDKMWEIAETNGDWLMQELKTRLSNNPRVGEIRGMGLEIGLVFVHDKNEMNPDINFASQVSVRALENNLWLNLGDVGSIQLMPPLTSSRDELEKGLKILMCSIDLAL